jgi:hypothetical protein
MATMSAKERESGRRHSRERGRVCDVGVREREQQVA